MKSDDREALKILFGLSAILIAGGLYGWFGGEEAMEDFRDWFMGFGWMLAAMLVLLVALLIAEKLFGFKGIGVHGKSEPPKTLWPREFVRDFLEDAIPTRLVRCPSEMAIDEAVEWAIETAGKTHGEERDSSPFYKDIFFLLGLNPSNLLWIDLECDPVPVYTEWFDQLAEISRGSFEPENVVEKWETEKGPIEVEFELGDKKYSVYPEYRGDWLDLRVLRSLNDIIRPSGRQFVVPLQDDQTAKMLCLKPEQKEVLEKRGWVFDKSFG
jgi:hypothetical protein